MNTKQYSILKSAVLHLLPGGVGTIAYVIIAPFLIENGYPSLLGILIAATIIIMPAELGYLFYQAKKLNKSFSLNGIVLYREALPKWQYVVIPMGLVIWGFLATGFTPLLDKVIAKSLFSWLPEWFFIFDLGQFQDFARPALLVTFWVGLIVNGFALPIVEELYFRGYLLPRLERFGKWTPLINLSFFSLYHFWTPWQFISRIILLLPWVYVTWRKRNIYLIMIAHCTANTIGWLLTWGLILG
jgi:membrane protease YdiL (CAAX protease family)